MMELALLMNRERSYQAAGTAGAKALGWELVWHDQGTSRRDGGGLEQHEGVEVGDEVSRRWAGEIEEDLIM